MFTPMAHKPPLGAQIDWSNPITNGLTNCFLFNEQQGNAVQDLVNPVSCPFAGATSPIWNTSTPRVEFTQNTSTYVDLSGARGITSFGAACSIEMLFYWPSLMKDKAFFMWDLSTSWKCGYVLNAAAPLWYTRTTTNATLSGTAATVLSGVMNHTVFTWDGSIKTVYINGRLYASDAPAHGAGILYLAGCNNIRIGCAGDYASEGFSVYLFRTWARPLDAVDVATLYYQPYAMFNRKPAWMAYTAPPVGTEYRMIYHNHYQQMRMV